MLKRFATLSIVLVSASTAFARISVPKPNDPYASMKPSEHIDAFDHGRARDYVELSLKNAISEELSFDRQVEVVENVTKQMVARYSPEEHMSVLSLMNSVLFEFATQYRHHGPLTEMKEVWIDSKSEKEIREMAVQAANVVFAAIANLPNEKFDIDPEFSQQHSRSTPLDVLKSYLSDSKNVGHDPFFANQHVPMLTVQIRRAQSKTGLFARARHLLSRTPKSCPVAFGVKNPAH